ncbi:MAG: ATP-binding protein [Clostridiales bacterium]|nr:ATP-binding protein [Clostridiales bacterium]MCC8082573.1 ATP-binding protein [Lachnospiraceae bacterium]
MLNIKNGKIPRPQKVVIYGAEGVGKTTLAAQFPDPLFIDTEGGTAHMDVRRIDRPATWEELLAIINEVAATRDVCKTLVIDTADWAEQLAIVYVCGKYKKAGIEEFGYSKGYVYLAEEFNRFFASLDKVIAVGIHVVVTAHAKMRKFEQPDEMGAYDRWETKLTKQVAPLLKEWCDMLLFCNYKTFIVQSDNVMEKAKVQGGKRVMYTSHHPCWDAKNRHGLPDELDLDFAGIAHIFNATPAAPAEKPIDALRSLMAKDSVSEADIQKVVADKGHYAADIPIEHYSDKFISGWLIKYWPQILNLINNSNQMKEDFDSE